MNVQQQNYCLQLKAAWIILWRTLCWIEQFQTSLCSSAAKQSFTYISNYQEVEKVAWKRMFVCWTNIVQTLHFFTFPLQSLIVENNWHTKKELQENIPHKSFDVELFWRALKSIDFFFLFNGCKNDFTKHFMNYYVMMKLQFLPTFPRRLNMLMFFCRLHRNDDDNIKVQKNRIWCGGKLLG